jgi:hypothetical protein
MYYVLRRGYSGRLRVRYVLRALSLETACCIGRVCVGLREPEAMLFHPVHLLPVSGDVVGVQGADGLVEGLEVGL